MLVSAELPPCALIAAAIFPPVVSAMRSIAESRMLAAFVASIEGAQVTDDQLEDLEMSTADFATYRQENERTISRLRRSCTEG